MFQIELRTSSVRIFTIRPSLYLLATMVKESDIRVGNIWQLPKKTAPCREVFLEQAPVVTSSCLTKKKDNVAPAPQLVMSSSSLFLIVSIVLLGYQF